MDLELISEALNEIEIKDNKTKDIPNTKDIPKLLLLNPDSVNLKYLKILSKTDSSTIKLTKLIGDNLYPIKCGYNELDKFFIIPYGGPTLTEDSHIPNNPRFKIKKIIYNEQLETYLIEII